MIMKILAIGDLHGKIPKGIPRDVDLILLTGDLGKADIFRKMSFKRLEQERKGLPETEYSDDEYKKGYMEVYETILSVVNELRKIAPVYLIYGNIERFNKNLKEYSKEIGLRVPSFHKKLRQLKNVRVLNNRVANFKGVRIGGLEFFVDVNWMKDFEPESDRKGEIKKQTEKAKRVLKWFDKVDILLCHQPPYGVLDKVGKMAPKQWRGKHAGSKTILSYIKRKKPRYCVCGHIHEGEGKKKVGKTEVYNLGCGGWKVLKF